MMCMIRGSSGVVYGAAVVQAWFQRYGSNLSWIFLRILTILKRVTVNKRSEIYWLNWQRLSTVNVLSRIISLLCLSSCYLVSCITNNPVFSNCSLAKVGIGTTITLWDPWDESPATLEIVGDQVYLVPFYFCCYYCYFLLSIDEAKFNGKTKRNVGK